MIDNLIGLIAPHICLGCEAEGAVLCADCADNLEQVPSRCAGCRRHTDNFATCPACKKWLPLDRVYVVAPYEGMASAVIKAMKFGSQRQATRTIVQAMFADYIPPDRSALLCPIPTAPKRIRERGFDHALRIAGQLSRQTKLPVSSLLVRTSNVRQVGSSRQDRIEHMEHEFIVKNRGPLPESVLLVDDVMTTGATIAGAARTLRKSGVHHVSALIFAQKS